MTEPLFRVTHTKVQTFLRCRRQYWFAYVNDEPWPEEEAEPTPLVIGNAVHRAMQELCESGDESAARQGMDTYLRMPKHAVAAPGTPGYEIAAACLEKGIVAHREIDSRDRWAEQESWVPLKKTGINVLAKIDRVDRLRDGTLQIIDWKTGLYDDPAIVDQQLDISHLAVRIVRKLGKDDRVRAIGWNLRSGTKRIRELERADAVATLRRMMGLAGRMQSESSVEASPGRHCAWCRWRARCDEAEELENGDWEDEYLDDLNAAGFADGATAAEVYSSASAVAEE